VFHPGSPRKYLISANPELQIKMLSVGKEQLAIFLVNDFGCLYGARGTKTAQARRAATFQDTGSRRSPDPLSPFHRDLKLSDIKHNHKIHREVLSNLNFTSLK
jgi:hypothetical protein